MADHTSHSHTNDEEKAKKRPAPSSSLVAIRTKTMMADLLNKLLQAAKLSYNADNRNILYAYIIAIYYIQQANSPFRRFHRQPSFLIA